MLAEHASVTQISKQDRADKAVVAQQQPAVAPAARIERHDLFVPVSRRGSPAAEQVDSRDFEGRGRRRSAIRCGRSRQRRAGDSCLLQERRPQAVHDIAMLGAFADRGHSGVARAQLVVDHNRPLDLKPGVAGQLHVGHHADGDHDHIRGQRGAVRQGDAGDGARAEQHLWLCVRAHVHAEAAQLTLQQGGRGWVELALHEVLGRVHHGDFGAARP